MTRRVTLVVNPTSGRGRALRMLPQVVGTLRDGGLDVEIELSRSLAEAEAMTARAVGDDVDVLAVMGGDGMMHLGLNTVAAAHRDRDSRTVLGVLPAGTGNDFARGIGLDPDDPVAAAGVIGGGRVQAVDLTEVGDGFVGGVVAAGFDALVNRRANALPWPKGALRYPVSALAELRGFSPLHYRLSVDGAVRELDAMLVAVGNTAGYGGGMQICPQADRADGWLDVTVIHPVSRAKLLQLMPQMYSGRFARDPCVEQLRAREVELVGPALQAFGDGEPIGDLPLRLSCRAGALPVFTA